MGRQTDFSDKTVTSGFGPDKELQYRGKEGEGHVIRIVSAPEEFMQHNVDDVLGKKPDGSPKVFPINCCKVWDDEAKGWSGGCEACERDYDLAPRYVAGLLFLGIKKGKAVMSMPPEGCARWWDFARSRFSDIRSIQDNLPEGKKVRDVEILVTCEPGGESFQKLKLQVYAGPRLTTREHLEAYKTSGMPETLKSIAASCDQKDMSRRLKRKGDEGGSTRDGASDGDELDLGEDAAPAKPRRSAKKAAPAPAAEDADELDLGGDDAEEVAPPPAKKAPAKAEDADDLDLGGDDAEEAAPAPPPKKAPAKAAPASAPAKKAAAPAKAAPAAVATTDDDLVEQMIAEAEG